MLSQPGFLHRQEEEDPSTNKSNGIAHKHKPNVDGLTIVDLQKGFQMAIANGHVTSALGELAAALPSLSSQALNAFQDPTGPPTEHGALVTDEDEEHGRRLLHAKWRERALLNHHSALNGPGDRHGQDQRAVDHAISLEPICRFALPSHFLYDTRGLQLFDMITQLPGDIYYLTEAEASILRERADEVAEHMLKPDTATQAQDQNRLPWTLLVIELGSGSMRKTKLLLDALERAARRRTGRCHATNVQFYALDLDRDELQKSLHALQIAGPELQGRTNGVPPASSDWERVQIRGLLGTYEQGLAWLRTSANAQLAARRAVLWLGSSIGNLLRHDSVAFLGAVRDCVLARPNDLLLLGLDQCTDRERVEHAYNDEFGLNRAFVLNMLANIAQHVKCVSCGTGIEVGDDVSPCVRGAAAATPFPFDAFEYASVYNMAMRRREGYLRAERALHLRLREIGDHAAQDGAADVRLQAGELLHVANSVKYTVQDTHELLRDSKWRIVCDLASKDYGVYLLAPAQENCST